MPMNKYPIYKKSAFITTFLCLLFSLTAKPVDNIQQFTLENGMEIFLLEDSTDALVHIEYTCRAGVSSQSHDNCGFFKLYTRLIENNNPYYLDFSEVQFNSDSSRFLLDITAPQLEETLSRLSDAVFAPRFSDELLTTQLEKLQNEVKDASEDMAQYINSAIDSKVFSEAPWKNDSGIYPPVFKHVSPEQARTHIKYISQNWYTPQNSALFISGNIDSEKIKLMLKNTFGKFYSSNRIPEKILMPMAIENKRFIMHSPDLSKDLTQVVVQYTTLDHIQSDIMAEALNNDKSSFKDELLINNTLNIPGDEYINISSKHQQDKSRLIIQTLLQPPVVIEEKEENKSGKITSANQVIDFLTYIQNIPKLISEDEFNNAKEAIVNNIKISTRTSAETMKYLADFWAVSPYYQFKESDFESYPNSLTTSLMMNKPEIIKETNFQNTKDFIQAESPFIFVIVNTDDFNNNREAYISGGFEEITPENSSWYVQEMYKEIKEQLEIKNPQYLNNNENILHSKSQNKDNMYYEKNTAQIKEDKLNNGIKLITKKTPDSTYISLLISIKGGRLNSANNNGFEELMIDIMTSMIEKELDVFKKQGIIKSEFEISSETNISTSSILINFQKEDIIHVCEAIKKGIIFGEIQPSEADRAISQKKYRKRIANGDVKNQMYSEVIKQTFGKGDFYNIFDSENEILTKISYKSILSEYHKYLDAGIYSLVVSGNFDDNIKNILETSLGMLSQNKTSQKKDNSQQHNWIKQQSIKNNITMPYNKTVYVKLRHTFLTDIPAEEAGPQPAELIPTTDFLDPVIYVIEAPEYGTKESALFKALLKYLERELNKTAAGSKKLKKSWVSIKLPENKINFATIIFYNASSIGEAESLYRATINNIIDDMESITKKERVFQGIKDNWTMEQMKNTSSNSGTVKLIYEGLEQFPESPRPLFYMDEYKIIQEANIKDFERAMNYFIKSINLKVYSEDSRK